MSLSDDANVPTAGAGEIHHTSDTGTSVMHGMLHTKVVTLRQLRDAIQQRLDCVNRGRVDRERRDG